MQQEFKKSGIKAINKLFSNKFINNLNPDVHHTIRKLERHN